MSRRPLFFALALALLPASAFAEDLLQTYELARTGDPQLSAAEADRRAVKEGAVQARGAMLPQIDASASFNRQRNYTDSPIQVDPDTGEISGGNRRTETSTRRTGVNVDQMVFDFGNFARLKSQKALSKGADFSLESAGDDLITRTSQAYFNVLVAIETLAAAEAQETALKKQFDFADKRLEVGLAPITDVHEARAQYDSARANTIVRRNELEDAYQALTEITGQPVRSLKGLPEDYKPELPPEQTVESWVESAVKNNPALMATQYQVESAAADVQTARAGHLPRLYLNGSYGDTTSWGDVTFAGTQRLPFSDDHGYGPSVGLTLSVPIFSGGVTQSQVRAAIARRDAAQNQLEQQKRALERSTRNAYQALIAGVSEVEARRLAVVSAKAAYEASQVGLEVGTRTVIDVLINQRNLFDAQQTYAQAKYGFLQNRLRLDQAAGTLDIADVQEINRLLTVNADAQLQPAQ
ncbi:TolC family outer membrane protein [Luteimonas sp. SX5]|uniref:Protein CyaE n=1 Tax=Luteimonas galliterrae TaxID=2940486 RepID=A0ABT0MLK0_9GAMM|nr:TolC family outer membrane protein [Luteimonas galliterrae]MCL1635543.1 TolC family outer membrane protein [Luteimonas galliterrae]